MACVPLCAVQLILYAVCVRRLPVLLTRGCPCFPFCVFCCHMAAACTDSPLSLLRPMAALRFSHAVLRGAYGGGFLAVWFGVGNARMRLGGGSLPCFCTLSSFFALFLTFCFRLSPRLISSSSLSALVFARSLAFPLSLFSFPLIPFLPLIPLSLRAFPGGRLSSVDLLISGGIYYII